MDNINNLFEPTNTLASANFDILKIDAVEDPLINVNKLATLDFEESYTAKAVKFINESRKEITDLKISFYKKLNESTSERIVLESFSDFFVGVKQIIDKFIKFLRKLADKFITAIMKMVKSDEFIKKHKDDIKNLASEVLFDFYGYTYTFNPNIPLASAALGYNNSLFDELYSNEKRELTGQSVRDSIIAMDLEKDYNLFRGRVIGLDGEEVYISEFGERLFEVFRDGDSSTYSITADYSYIIRCLDRFLNYDQMKKEVERNRNDIEKAYNRVQKEVSDITKNNNNLDKQAFLSRLPQDNMITDVETSGGGTMMAAELMSQIDVYVKAKIEQIQEYSNIHLLAFGAKLDAMKECMIQDRSVLYTTLSKTGFAPKGGKR